MKKSIQVYFKNVVKDKNIELQPTFLKTVFLLSMWLSGESNALVTQD